MTLEQMTHTCWRCRFGHYRSGKAFMVCAQRKDGKTLTDKECKSCEYFKPSVMACDYFRGARLQADHRRILTEIYTERVKRRVF